MTRDHLLGFPALLRQHDEPAAPKKPTVKERPAAFVAFETGDWTPVFVPSRKGIVIDPKAETREVTFTDVRNAYRRVRHELGGVAARTLRREFGVDLCLELKPEQWAEFIATAERRLAGWVKWSGGKQPVADLQMVEIRFRAWPETKGYAGNLGPWWWHREESNRFADIVEYRVVVEAKQADGWIKWSGGEQPVANSTKVEVRYGEGTKDCGPAGDWDWRHHGDASGDIVEYRVIK